MKMIKTKWDKMLKVYEIIVFFHCPPYLQQNYVLYTWFNVDNYGRPLSLQCDGFIPVLGGMVK